MIENFLLMNKFKIEKVKQKIDMYYTVRTLIPEMFDKDPNSPTIQNVMNIMYVTMTTLWIYYLHYIIIYRHVLPLPRLTNRLHRVFIAGKLTDHNTDKFDSTDYTVFLYNQIEIRLRYDCNLAMIYVYDFLNLKPGHLLKYTPTLMKTLAFIGDVTNTSTISSFLTIIFLLF